MTTSTGSILDYPQRPNPRIPRRVIKAGLIGIAGLAVTATVVTVAPSVVGASPAHHATHVAHVNFEKTTTWVKNLQKELASLNYYEGPIDGIYGPQTRAAVTFLQRDASIHQTGQMNAATGSALQRFLANGNNQMNPNNGSTLPVTTLQEDLGRLNYYEGPDDGIFGPQTKAAVADLQRDAGLPQTGAMNATTEAALQRFLVHGNSQMNPGGGTTVVYAAR
jgi:peptidoglycan hydrolase-like protein with peptidoglycan-binding domain